MIVLHEQRCVAAGRNESADKKPVNGLNDMAMKRFQQPFVSQVLYGGNILNDVAGKTLHHTHIL